MLGLRLGDNPRVCVTTTPKPVRLIKDLVGDPTTALVRGSTYDNRRHLAPSFFEKIVATYEGTRLGQQEIHAEIIEVGEGAWFTGFDPARHVSVEAEYDPRLAVHLAIDCGVSRHVGAVWFQVRPVDAYRQRVSVFGDLHKEGLFSEAAAKAVWAHSGELPSLGRLDTVRLDPASTARTGIGPAAYGEFERVFGRSNLGRWPAVCAAQGRLPELCPRLSQRRMARRAGGSPAPVGPIGKSEPNSIVWRGPPGRSSILASCSEARF